MFANMTRTFVPGVALAALALLSCDHACTQIGCGAAFSVEFQRAAWTAGDYVITVTADGQTTECTATLPLDCAAPPPCGDAAGLILIQDGCALAASEHKLGGVEFLDGQAPTSVNVRVEQDGALLGEAVYAPAYTESRPNGDDCEPTCNQADGETLALK
jgi:hypothetical protein